MIFHYKGAVTLFGRIIAFQWEATTRATSMAKAISNLKFQYRRAFGLEMNVPIQLVEKVTTV